MVALKKSRAPSLSSASLNAYLAGKGSPMKDQGPSYMEVCEQYDLDPRFLIALSGAETQFGRNITWGAFNAWNWGWNVRHQRESPFASWRSGMTSVARNLRKDSSLYDLSSVATTYSLYCKGPCTDGRRNIHGVMAEFGADETALGFPVIGGGRP